MSGKIIAGLIQHPDSVDPNLVLNDDGTVDLFGGDGLGDVVGPESSTDNALARFDGTGGNALQNSGITVDDSGNVTSDVVLSKANPVISAAATSGNAEVRIQGAAATLRFFRFRTGTSRRWLVGAIDDPESGSNVGSTFQIWRYSDADAYAGVPIAIARATGKITFGDIGATAGLELGASGPRVMAGTGSPEGVVTAPVGSTWRDTNATTGAIKWIKASGTGNTGWVVEYGDTGWRNVAALASATTITYGILRLRRSRDLVTLHVAGSNSVTTATAIFAAGVIPVGFRPNTTFTTTGGRDGLTSWPSPHQAALEVTSGGGATFRANNAEVAYLMAQWSTSDAWPSSLPGSAA